MSNESAVPSTISPLNRTVSCEPGLFIPPWTPEGDLTDADVVFRGIVYILSMAYLFVGIAYLSDKFMSAIETITSKRKVVEREVRLNDGTLQNETVVIRIWNETVANLTLMALGCSAPEILLSGIEIVGNGFDAGELGPGAIVGSAAFNLIFVIGVCNWVIPRGQVRKINRLNVFLITSAWSIFAYLWLYIILSVSTPGVIELWEALVTLACFPLTVISAYVADRYAEKGILRKTGYRLGRSGDVIIETPGSLKGIDELEDHRKTFLHHLKEIRRKNPALDAPQLELMASRELSISSHGALQAAKKLTGLNTLSIRNLNRRHNPASTILNDHQEVAKDIKAAVEVYFHPAHYTISETVGQLVIQVMRDEKGDLNVPLTVDYATEDAGGSARRWQDYIPAKGTLTFQPGESKKEILIEIIDDSVYEGDIYFYVRLLNPRSDSGREVRLGCPSLATVLLLDDDHAGIFTLKDRELVVTDGSCFFQVIRHGGSRGRVALPYRTEEGTAKPDRDYGQSEGVLTFEEGETEKTVAIEMLKNAYEKDVVFRVILDEPTLAGGSCRTESFSVDSRMNLVGNQISQYVEFYMPTWSDERTEEERDRINLEGRPRLGEVRSTLMRISQNVEFKNSVDRLVKRSKWSAQNGFSAWKEQLIDAFFIEKSEETENDFPFETTWKDYIIHILTVFWRFVCALIPPEKMGNGYPCFVVSIVFIGVVTALVGDLASHLGCTIGLKDSVTALAFVSLGTSCPELFSSRLAAIQNEYADASISNVTGANAINVYLGIGLAWSMAAIYHTINGTDLTVLSASLGFSVTIYSCLAVCVVLILLIRRHPQVSGGELGGPFKFKLPTSILFISMWILFVLICSFEAYGYIKGF